MNLSTSVGQCGSKYLKYAMSFRTYFSGIDKLSETSSGSGVIRRPWQYDLTRYLSVFLFGIVLLSI